MKNLEKILDKHLGILGINGSGKALCIYTPIPTPSGWTTMGALSVGDALFDDTGQPCVVEYATPIQFQRECYRVIFSDGCAIVADADHLWLTESYASRTADNNAKLKGSDGKGRDGRWQCQRRSFPSLVTTKEMNATLISGTPSQKIKNHVIRNTLALHLPRSDLPIDPYVLGCWLGDGTAASATICTIDEQILDNIRAVGYEVTPSYKSPKRPSEEIIYRIRSLDGVTLSQKLRESDLLDNKHVPPAYLRASREQRIALLSGLMDTDGTIQRGSNSCIFYNMNRHLAEAVYELVCSLGWMCTHTTKRATLRGVDHGVCHQIRFRPTESVFRLK